MLKRLTALMMALTLAMTLLPSLAEDLTLDSLMAEIETVQKEAGPVPAGADSLVLLEAGTELYIDPILSVPYGTLLLSAPAYVVDTAESGALLAAIAVRGAIELLWCQADTLPLSAEEAGTPGEGVQVPGTELWLANAELSLADETEPEAEDLPVDVPVAIDIEPLDDSKADFRIVTQPQTQVKAVGQTVTLSLTATGAKSYQWQWSKDGQTWNNCSGNGYNKATMAFSMKTTFHGRLYQCKVTGTDGTVKYTSAAGVYLPVSITVQPQSQTRANGQTVSLKVEATGVKSYQWQWSKDGETWNNNTGNGYNKATFTFSMKEVFHGRMYRCLLTGYDDTVTPTAAAELKAAPAISVQPQSQVKAAGQTVTLSVTATGVKSYQWQWSADGTTWKNNTSSGYNKATFAFSMSEAFSGRQYRCVITGLDGSTLESESAFVSTEALSIRMHPGDITVNAGWYIIMKVTATGVKSYQWQYSADGVTWKNNTGNGYNKDSMKFKVVEAFSGRKYRCEVRGKDGTVKYTRAATVLVQADITNHPQDMTMPAGSTMTLRIAATGVKSYQWQWSADGTTWKNCSSAGYNKNAFSFKMTAAFNGRKYRCLVTGLDGVEVPSNAATVTIGDDPYAEGAVRAKMLALQDEYYEGRHWDNSDFYAWNGGIYSGGYGCAGFAFMLSDAAFGTLPARKLTSFTWQEVRVGDILRVNNDTHSVVVLEKYSDHVVLAEGNYNSSIHWGRTLTQAQVMDADYLMTRYPQ